MPSGSRPFHGGRGSVDYDDAEFFSGDPRIAPGLPRAIGWRVRNGDGSEAYDKYGPADTDWIPIGGVASASLLWLFELALSFGHGAAVDAELPDDDGDAETFWLGPSVDADHATADQVREWPSPDPVDRVGIIAYVDAANLLGGSAQLIPTIDGVDVAGAAVTIPAGVSSALLLQAEADVYAPALSRLGVRFAPGAGLTGGTLRCEVRLRGRMPASGELTTPTSPGGAPLIWLEADLDCATTPASPLPLVTQWTNQGSLGLGVGQPPTIFAGPPQFVEDQQNGLPVVRFVDQVALLTSDVVTPFAPGDPFTIIVVTKPTSAVGGIMFSSPFQDSSPFRGVGLLTDAGEQYPFPSEFTGAGPSIDGGPVDRTGQVLLCAFYFDGDYDGGRADINGVRQALTGTIDTPVAGDAYCIGGACVAGFNGSWKGSDQDMMAILVYAGDLDGTATIAQTLAYLRAKWGLP